MGIFIGHNLSMYFIGGACHMLRAQYGWHMIFPIFIDEYYSFTDEGHEVAFIYQA